MPKHGRNGNGEGSIFRCGNGWRGFITIGYDGRGKQVKKWRRGATRRQVAEKLNQIAAESGSRLIARPELVTLEEWLTRFVELRKRDVRPRTLENYGHYLAHILPVLGQIQIHRLKPLQVRQFYGNLSDKGLSPSVRKHVHHFLKSGLTDAVKMGVLDRNPIDVLDCPRGGNVVTAKVWTPSQVEQFIHHAQYDRLHGVFYLALTLGMRIGELLGLMWSDIDGETLRVQRTLSVVGNVARLGPPKTERGYRTIYLSGSDVDVLKHRREAQEFERSVARRWEDHGLVFSSQVGTPMSQHNVRRTFRLISTRAGVPRIRVHDLRHTHITLARDAGMDVETVANRVGQDVRVTLRTYSNVTEARKKKAAIGLSDLLNGKK